MKRILWENIKTLKMKLPVTVFLGPDQRDYFGVMIDIKVGKWDEKKEVDTFVGIVVASDTRISDDEWEYGAIYDCPLYNIKVHTPDVEQMIEKEMKNPGSVVDFE